MARNSTSSPFLSGDAFASLCDFNLTSDLDALATGDLTVLRNARTIFCVSHYLDSLLVESRNLSCRVILAGNSDLDFLDLPDAFHPHLRLMALQNSHVSDGDRIITLPIGLENRRLAQNGQLRYFRSTRCNEDIEAVSTILVGPFSPTHPSRRDIVDQLRDESGPWTVLEQRVPSAHLERLILSHSMVLCPRGNGSDTHRVWETLYRGVVPVVEDNEWSRSLRTFGLPMVLVPDMSPESLRVAASTATPSFLPDRLMSLWIPAWQERLRVY